MTKCLRGFINVIYVMYVFLLILSLVIILEIFIKNLTFLNVKSVSLSLVVVRYL